MLQLGLFLLMLHALPETHSYRQVHKKWILTTPRQVQATRGSCLVIPCSYTFPQTFRTIKHYRGLWKKGKADRVVVSSRWKDPVFSNYKERTNFLGHVSKKNCTWMLTDVQDSDADFYIFRIEMPKYYQYSWSYQPMELQVVDPQRPEVTMREVIDRGQVYMMCSLIHSCPLHPPTLSWSHDGTVLRGSHKVNDWQWWIYTTLVFSPEHTPIQEVTCTVQYHGGGTVQSRVLLV